MAPWTTSPPPGASQRRRSGRGSLGLASPRIRGSLGCHACRVGLAHGALSACASSSAMAAAITWPTRRQRPAGMPMALLLWRVIRYAIQLAVAARIAASFWPTSLVMWALTSSAKWRPSRLSRKARTSSRLQPVASATIVSASAHAAFGSAWCVMVPKKPQASFWLAGMAVAEMGMFESSCAWQPNGAAPSPPRAVIRMQRRLVQPWPSPSTSRSATARSHPRSSSDARQRALRRRHPSRAWSSSR